MKRKTGQLCLRSWGTGVGGVLLKDMEPHVLEALRRFLKERKLCSSTGALSWESVNMRQLPTILEFV